MKYLLLDGDRYKVAKVVRIDVRQFGLGTGKVVIVKRGRRDETNNS